jgi:high-affinity K+ transport system ATPase subunit B
MKLKDTGLTAQDIKEMMKKAAPIAAVLCVLMFVTMLCKTVMNKTVVISQSNHQSESESAAYQVQIQSSSCHLYIRRGHCPLMRQE